MADYDYVIVGAGAAGCVLANRLSEDPATSVCLVEAGGGGIDHLIGDSGADSLNGAGGLAFADYSTAAAGLVARACLDQNDAGFGRVDVAKIPA